jgi:Xaa-Pro dipeptidase
MVREGIAMAMFEDTEGRRDPALRWLCGHPGDALLFLQADKRTLLVAWDISIARFHGEVDHISPYSDFGRRPIEALRNAAEFLKAPYGSRLEIPPVTPYPLFLQYLEESGDYDILCRRNGLHDAVRDYRAVKDEEEIRIYHEAGAITNGLIDQLEAGVREGVIKTELDAALFLEAESRRQGCEGLGFETLAAGPSRSFAIHAFPAYTSRDFGGPGMSILDFGVQYQGYITDVTMSFVRGPLSRAQEKQISLVEKAARTALPLMVSGAVARNIALAVDDLFGKARKVMPHGLGHGVGLETHEAPALSSRAENTDVLKAGMIVTLEPGLYHPVLGGCRLENDVLITDAGPQLLTNSRIVRL